MTTKLEELKKLKVPELKYRLKELGLDTKGLKAELIGRLWSAVDGKLESKLQNDTTKPHFTSSAEEEAVSPPLPAPRQYCDTATQTDMEPSVAAVSADCRPGLGSDEDDPMDSGTQREAKMGKGRAFYEFKEEIRYKRSKLLPPVPVTGEIVEEDQSTVKIDLDNSHLHFEVEPDGTSGHPRFWEQFPLLWSGCRLSHGVKQNRVGFEVRLERLLSSQPQGQKDVELDAFGLRVGWSGASTSLMLGNDFLSFAYDGRGKKVCQGKEDDYGEPLSVGDIIGCYASFSWDGAVELSFHKNGFFMGVAFSLDASVLHGQPLFPHVACRSCSVRFLLDPLSRPWYPSPPGYTSLIALPDEQKICAVSASKSKSKSECEVILMVGFPGSGKTQWAKNYINQHPEKHYKLLNTEELLACMTTNVQRDIKLQQASRCLTELIKLAAERSGNYILDQCNILFSARQYKLQLFNGFRRKVVVIFPSKEEWKRRLSKHQREGNQIPQAALLKLQVSCTLPEQDNLIEELQYVELFQQAAQTVLQEYKNEARRLLPPAPKHYKKPHHKKTVSYPHRLPLSYKTQDTGQNGWSNLQSWSQPQQLWPSTYLQGYYSNIDLSSCGYQSYW